MVRQIKKNIYFRKLYLVMTPTGVIDPNADMATERSCLSWTVMAHFVFFVS